MSPLTVVQAESGAGISLWGPLPSAGHSPSTARLSPRIPPIFPTLQNCKKPRRTVSQIDGWRSGASGIRSVSFSVEPGEYVAIMGESGSGKTTLLNILAALDRPTAGEVYLNGKALSGIRERDLAAFRRSHLGFVFQDFNLLDTFSLRDNIFLPLVLAGKDFEAMDAKLRPLAKQLGIADILEKYPYEVSGGQKQRCAAARALITGPQIVLADEPTGALDSRASDNLLELFGEINRDGQTILMVTHSVKAASHAGRVLFLRDGQVYHQLYRGGETQESQFRRISDTLTVLSQGGESHA